MMEKGKMERGVVELVDTESLVPQEHLLRKVDRAVEFRKLYEIVEPLYSEEEGRTSIDPVVLFKIVLLQHLDGIPSLRGTLRRAQTDILVISIMSVRQMPLPLRREIAVLQFPGAPSVILAQTLLPQRAALAVPLIRLVEPV